MMVHNDETHSIYDVLLCSMIITIIHGLVHDDAIFGPDGPWCSISMDLNMMIHDGPVMVMEITTNPNIMVPCRSDDHHEP